MKYYTIILLLAVCGSATAQSWLFADKANDGEEAGIQIRKAGNVLFYLYSDNGSNALNFQSTQVTGEHDAYPRFQMPLTSPNLYLALSGGRVGIGTDNPQFGKLQLNQSSDASDQGIGILNSTGVRAMRLWADQNNSYVYSGGTGQAPLILNDSGNVGIGTATPDSKLSVNGTIHAKEVKVDLSNWPDYVFKKDYRLPSLEELESYINTHQHLPEVPSEEEVTENGVMLGEMNKLLLQKIEEMTLYMIEQNKQLKVLKDKVDRQEAELKLLKK